MVTSEHDIPDSGIDLEHDAYNDKRRKTMTVQRVRAGLQEVNAG